MDECTFCRVLRGELPSTVIHANDLFVAILNLSGYTDGHILILPKKHHETTATFSDAEKLAFFEMVDAVEVIHKERYGAKGTRVWWNIGRAAGQMQIHMHAHAFPFRPDEIADGLRERFAENMRESAG